ncbi:MAG: NUDIX hydrolase [Clostridia bacterium]|nr:NUDIX hydrolase [Clostridia bacterium]
MDRIQIRRDQVVPLLDTKFVRVFDLQYREGKHYYDATRRKAEDLVALKDTDSFRQMTPDAVTCFVILEMKGEEPKMLLSREYRYPTGQFLLSVPAGLIDPEDLGETEPALVAARREIAEETGLHVGDGDRLSLISPLVFSTPGMTDESNALVSAVLHPDNLSGLTQAGAVGSELFDGFILATEADARRFLKDGRDERGIFYSLQTWAGLMWFLSGMWKE